MPDEYTAGSAPRVKATRGPLRAPVDVRRALETAHGIASSLPAETPHLLELQMEALYELDGAGRILANRDPEIATPRLHLCRTEGGLSWRLAADLPPALAASLTALLEAEPSDEDLRPRVRAMLTAHRPIRQEAAGPHYAFPPDIPEPDAVIAAADSTASPVPELAWVRSTRPEEEPVFVREGRDQIVAVCHSARSAARSAEAGVETAPAFRRQDHAVAVTQAWARAIRAEDREPLYSTSWENMGSQGVARRLGLRLYATDWTIA